MNKFILKKKVPIWKIAMGSIALVTGILSAFVALKGLILIGMGLFLLLTEGSEFNFEEKKYRKVKSILGISVGKWEPIPKIEYVSVFKTTETVTLRDKTAEANVTNEIIKLNLFYNTNQKIEAYNTYNIDDAFEKAKEIATLLNTKIYDATTNNAKWL